MDSQELHPKSVRDKNETFFTVATGIAFPMFHHKNNKEANKEWEKIISAAILGTRRLKNGLIWHITSCFLGLFLPKNWVILKKTFFNTYFWFSNCLIK